MMHGEAKRLWTRMTSVRQNMKRAQYFLDRKDFAVFDLQRRIRENCKRFYRIQCQIEKGGPLEVLRAVTNEKAVVVGMIKKDLGQGANTIFKARRRAEKEWGKHLKDYNDCRHYFQEVQRGICSPITWTTNGDAWPLTDRSIYIVD